MKENIKKIEVLFIEDHDIIIDAYLLVLKTFFKSTEIEHYRCNNCQEAYSFLHENTTKSSIDLVFLDYSLPAFTRQKIYNGLDLLPLLNECFPKAYLIFLTSFNFGFLIYDVHQKHAVNAIASKSELNTSTLIYILKKFLNRENYYSDEVIKLIEMIKQHPIFLDQFNRSIVKLMSINKIGVEIANELHISLSGLNKRKFKLKKALPIPTEAKDYDIVKYCRIHQFL